MHPLGTPLLGALVIRKQYNRPPGGGPKMGLPEGVPGGLPGRPRGAPGRPGRGGEISRNFPAGRPGGGGGPGGSRRGSPGGSRLGVPDRGLGDSPRPVTTDPVCDAQCRELSLRRRMLGFLCEAVPCRTASRRAVARRDAMLGGPGSAQAKPAPAPGSRGHGDPLVRMRRVRRRSMTSAALRTDDGHPSQACIGEMPAPVQ